MDCYRCGKYFFDEGLIRYQGDVCSTCVDKALRDTELVKKTQTFEFWVSVMENGDKWIDNTQEEADESVKKMNSKRLGPAERIEIRRNIDE